MVDETTAARDALARTKAAWYTERRALTEVLFAALVDRGAIHTLMLRVSASRARLRLAIMLLHVWRPHGQELLMPPGRYAFAAVVEVLENAMRRLGANMVLINGEAAAATEVERERQICVNTAVVGELFNEEMAAVAQFRGEPEAAEREFNTNTPQRVLARARADEIARARALGGGNPLRGARGERLHRGGGVARLVDVREDSPAGVFVLLLARETTNTWDEIAARLAVRRPARGTRSAATCFSPHLPSLTRTRALALSLSQHPQRAVLQVHFVDFRGVTGRTVADWAHAAGLPARPRRALLSNVAPRSEEGRFILRLALNTRQYTWDTIAAQVGVRHQALRARSTATCVLTPHPFLPRVSRTRALSLALSQHRQRTFGRHASRIWAPCRTTRCESGHTQTACRRDRGAVFFTTSRRVQMRAG